MWDPSLIYEYARLNSHDTHSDIVVIIDILLRTRITQVSKAMSNVNYYQLATLDLTLYDTPARHTKLFSYYYFNYFRHVAMLQFAGPLVGAPFCGGPCSAEHAEHA